MNSKYVSTHSCVRDEHKTNFRNLMESDFNFSQKHLVTVQAVVRDGVLRVRNMLQSITK